SLICAAWSSAGACSACGWARSPTSCSCVASWDGNSPRGPGKKYASDYGIGMDHRRQATDELWLRLSWFTRIRWIVPPLVVGLCQAIALLTGRPLFPMTPLLAVLGAELLANGAYTLLLRRWRGDPGHGR